MNAQLPIEEQPTTILPRLAGTIPKSIPEVIDDDTPEENAERRYHAALIEAYVASVRASKLRVGAEICSLRGKLQVKYMGLDGDLHATVCQEFEKLAFEGLKLAADICPDDCVDIGGAK